MISFESLVLDDHLPIYLQIILFVKRGIASGAFACGDALPSRRLLSARLGVNPNTIQKAFRALEAERLISSHGGAASVLDFSPDDVLRVRAELLADDIARAVRALHALGLSKHDALALVEKYWEDLP